MRRLKIFVVVVLSLLALCVIWAKLPIAALPEGSQATAWLEPGTFSVASEQETLIDTTRSTPPHRTFLGAPDRTLAVRIWYPEGPPRPMPLVVYSHGFGGMRDDLGYLCERLASHGFVVASLSFPATNARAPGGPNVADVVSQPGDQRFLIDHLLARSGSASDTLASRIDPERIGAFGLSLGGLTTILLSYDRQRMDPRIKAAASIVGLHAMLRRPFFDHRAIAFMEIAGTNDEVVPYASNGSRVPEDIPNSLLVTLANGTHSGSVGLFSYLRFMTRIDSVACGFINRQAPAPKNKGPGWEVLGTADEGVIAEIPRDLCTLQPTAPAMDPRRQQQLTTIAVVAFFEAELAANTSARTFLREQLDKEMPDVKVTLGH